jgi:hypothetical protein
MLRLGITCKGTQLYVEFNGRILKYANRPLSTIETFSQKFVPSIDEQSNDTKSVELEIEDSKPSVSEVARYSVYAMDVLAEIYVEKKPKLAKVYLELAGKYDPMRKAYWSFRLEKLDHVA